MDFILYLPTYHIHKKELVSSEVLRLYEKVVSKDAGIVTVSGHPMIEKCVGQADPMGKLSPNGLLGNT